MNRRLLAFRSAFFSLTLILPPPLDMLLIPMYLGLKQYNLLTIFFGFKLIVNNAVWLTMWELLTQVFLVARVLSEEVSIQVLSANGVSTAVARDMIAMMNTDPTLMLGMVLFGVALDLSVMMMVFVYPTYYIRRKVYPRIHRLLY